MMMGKSLLLNIDNIASPHCYATGRVIWSNFLNGLTLAKLATNDPAPYFRNSFYYGTNPMHFH